MKQTAVEWLVDYLKNIKELPFIRQNLNMNEQNILDDIIEQAKEMEKEQIEQAYFDGTNYMENVFGKNPTDYYEAFSSKTIVTEYRDGSIDVEQEWM